MRNIKLICIATLFLALGIPAALAQTASVSATSDDTFDPAGLEVSVGTTVTWTNDDEEDPHTVTADDGAFDSGNLDPGEDFSHTFDEAGDFPYFCEIHDPEMVGSIIVTRQPTDPQDDNGGDDVAGEDLPTTGPADLWAFVYVAFAFMAAGSACLRLGRTPS